MAINTWVTPDSKGEVVQSINLNDGRRYEITKEPSVNVPSNFTYYIYHLNEMGDTLCASYWEKASGEYQGYTFIKPEQGTKRSHFVDGTITECATWLINQHGMWLDEQFEKAFSDSR